MAKIPTKSILFLCTGNYYRSRFAEILFNSVSEKMGLSWQANSRALALERGIANVGPISTEVLAMLKSKGIPPGAATLRMPAPLTVDDLTPASRIVALSREEHHPLVQERFPDWTDKIEFWNVEDAEGALNLIEAEVMALIARILGGGERTPPEIAPKRAEVKKPPKPITLKVGRETAHRRGKGVTTIFDLPMSEEKIHELATLLKQKCGTGGTVKDGRIEIQGDQRERIIAELVKLGYQVKRVGG